MNKNILKKWGCVRITLLINVGRRVPKSWFRRTASKVTGLITFQSHIWTMINQAMSMAKRKANADGRLKFVMTKDKESEDLNYQIEWLKIVIQGTEEQEEEEYNESMMMYKQLGKVLKKDMPVDERFSKAFKSKVLTPQKIQEAYSQGYGAAEESNIANKLLEMGILTHIEWQKDFENREVEIKPDF